MSKKIEIPVNGTQLEMFSAIVELPKLTVETCQTDIRAIRESEPDPQLTMLSFGGGQDSWAILYSILNDKSFRKKYAPKDLVVVMSDTGNEFPYTLKANQEAKKLCEQNNIPFFFLTNDMGYHTPGWMSLKDNLIRNSVILSATMGGIKPCTGSLKINPLDKFLYQYMSKLYGYPEVVYNLTEGRASGNKKNFELYEKEFNSKVRVLIGFARHEERRVIASVNLTRTKDFPKYKKRHIQYVYPLVEEGWDRDDAQGIIRKYHDYLIPPSNCMICFYQSNEELVWLERNHPEEIEQWEKMEQAKLKKFADRKGTNNGVYGAISLREKLEQAKNTISKDFNVPIGELTDEQLWEVKLSHGHCVKSSF
jgi:hypothetical protein